MLALNNMPGRMPSAGLPCQKSPLKTKLNIKKNSFFSYKKSIFILLTMMRLEMLTGFRAIIYLDILAGFQYLF
jgi:hypothetical protein